MFQYNFNIINKILNLDFIFDILSFHFNSNFSNDNFNYYILLYIYFKYLLQYEMLRIYNNN